MKLGFDHDKYTRMQSERIMQRIDEFGGKLYLELGGKLFDDFHASRVLPGFKPDSKVQMLLKMKDKEEILIAVNANDIETSKIRGDLGITYDLDTLRLIDAFRSIGLYVGSVVLTRWAGQPAAVAFEQRLNAQGIKTYRHYPIEGYPTNIEHIVSDDGFGRNDYVPTVTTPLKDIPPILSTSSAMTVSAGTTMLRPPAPWCWSPRLVPEAAKWPPASASCTRKTAVASKPAMPSLKPSPSGTCRSSIR